MTNSTSSREPLFLSDFLGLLLGERSLLPLERLRAFIASGEPPADAIDEVGIVTTTLGENHRYYWSDGTHLHDRVHIALGNNVRRDVLVHGPKHMDGEVDKPTIRIDGRLIVRDGIWIDSGPY